MGQIKKKPRTAKFKAQVALEAIKEAETTGQIASKYQVHPTQVGLWKSQLIREAGNAFSNKEKNKNKRHEEQVNELYRQIGIQKVEIDFLKKNVGLFE
jgi:transposase